MKTSEPDSIRNVEALGYLLDDRYLLHNPGTRHPESPGRLAAIKQTLKEICSSNGWSRIQPREASIEELELIHNPALIEYVERSARRAPSYLDMDTPVSFDSYSTALLAAGGVLECVDMLCSGRLRRAFAFIRPPGHHASSDSSRGFCLFNNAALAAAYARHKYRLERIAIADFDVHHGNGTQSCFYDSPHVLYISTHQFPFYPGTGDFHEVGTGDGKGFTLNIPMPEGTTDAGFAPVYSRIMAAALDQYEPQLILVSAGFDGHYKDPLGGFSLTASGYGSAAASLILAAERWCEGKICFILEGGYSMQGLQESSHAVMAAMERQLPAELSLPEEEIFKEISSEAAKYSCWRW